MAGLSDNPHLSAYTVNQVIDNLRFVLQDQLLTNGEDRQMGALDIMTMQVYFDKVMEHAFPALHLSAEQRGPVPEWVRSSRQKLQAALDKMGQPA